MICIRQQADSDKGAEPQDSGEDRKPKKDREAVGEEKTSKF